MESDRHRYRDRKEEKLKKKLLAQTWGKANITKKTGEGKKGEEGRKTRKEKENEEKKD